MPWAGVLLPPCLPLPAAVEGAEEALPGPSKEASAEVGAVRPGRPEASAAGAAGAGAARLWAKHLPRAEAVKLAK